MLAVVSTEGLTTKLTHRRSRRGHSPFPPCEGCASDMHFSISAFHMLLATLCVAPIYESSGESRQRVDLYAGCGCDGQADLPEDRRLLCAALLLQPQPLREIPNTPSSLCILADPPFTGPSESLRKPLRNPFENRSKSPAHPVFRLVWSF